MPVSAFSFQPRSQCSAKEEMTFSKNMNASYLQRDFHKIYILGSLGKLRRRRQRERHQTKSLMSKTIAAHVLYKSSLPSSTKQRREMAKFFVVERKRLLIFRRLSLRIIQLEQVFRAIGALNRSTQCQISLKNCKFIFDWGLSAASQSSLLKLPIIIIFKNIPYSSATIAEREESKKNISINTTTNRDPVTNILLKEMYSVLNLCGSFKMDR